VQSDESELSAGWMSKSGRTELSIFLEWQNPIIGHLQHHLRDPSRDHIHGRIYRVTLFRKKAPA